MSEVVREVLAEELQRLSDPRLVVVTVTGVDVKSDLRTAIVYYSCLGSDPDARDDAARALTKAAPHLRQVLGRQVRLKSTPALEFVLDPAIDAGARIDEVLRDLHRDGHSVTSASAGEPSTASPALDDTAGTERRQES